MKPRWKGCLSLLATAPWWVGAPVGAHELSAPPQVAMGEPVEVRVAVTSSVERVEGTVETPEGRRIDLRFTPGADHVYSADFTNTQDRGFMTADWDTYRVDARIHEPGGVVVNRRCSFRLPETDKRLDVVFWVDDLGTGGELDPELAAWYHEHAGPISYLLQKDQTRPYNLAKLLAKYDFEYDYLGHHFQVFQWTGSAFLLALNNHVYLPYLAFRYAVNGRVGFKLIRVQNVVGVLLLASAVAVYLATRKKRRRAWLVAVTCLFLAGAFVGLRVNHVRIVDWSNWSFEHNNPAWCKEFLLKAEQDFRDNGFEFTPVIRHGWNLPPSDLMDFYMAELGVLADASMISGAGTNDYLTTFKFEGRNLVSPESPLPYYASLAGDYNVAWNGMEADRGVLEIPLTFPNAQRFTMDEATLARIRDLPNGALLSTYLHPGDNDETLRALVDYLNETYHDLHYVRADDYARLYMAHHPRPVLVGDDLQARWACLLEGALKPIRETDKVTTQQTHSDPNSARYSVTVTTRQPVPLLELPAPKAKRATFDGDPVELKDGRVTVRYARPGTHLLALELAASGAGPE